MEEEISMGTLTRNFSVYDQKRENGDRLLIESG